MLSELDKTFSEKVTYAEQSVRRMKKVHLAHICTSLRFSKPRINHNSGFGLKLVAYVQMVNQKYNRVIFPL